MKLYRNGDPAMAMVCERAEELVHSSFVIVSFLQLPLEYPKSTCIKHER